MLTTLQLTSNIYTCIPFNFSAPFPLKHGGYCLLTTNDTKCYVVLNDTFVNYYYFEMSSIDSIKLTFLHFQQKPSRKLGINFISKYFQMRQQNCQNSSAKSVTTRMGKFLCQKGKMGIILVQLKGKTIALWFTTVQMKGTGYFRLSHAMHFILHLRTFSPCQWSLMVGISSIVEAASRGSASSQHQHQPPRSVNSIIKLNCCVLPIKQ